MPWFYYDEPEQDDKADKVKLSKQRPLKIISDSDTNSILVQGADAAQLKRIEDLILFYDKPEPTDAQSVRKRQTFTLHYSKAKVIAETIKDVYRDLLSANDKALATNQPQQPQRSFFWSNGRQRRQGAEGAEVQGTDFDRRGRALQYAGRLGPGVPVGDHR